MPKSWASALSDKAVTKYYNEQVEEAFPDKADYTSWLEENQMTERQVWESMRNSLFAQAIYDKLGKDIAVTDEEVKNAYEKDPSQWETRKASHIIIMPADDSEQALATAEAQGQGSDQPTEEWAPILPL